MRDRGAIDPHLARLLGDCRGRGAQSADEVVHKLTG
jgi:hypothetical protein